MGKMLIFATNLQQITAATGSQIRMEMYARAGEKMASYVYWQDVQKNVENQVDLVLINSSERTNKEYAEARANVKQLGETVFPHPVSGYGDDVNEFTGKKKVTSAVLTFLDDRSKDKFLASFKIDVGDKDGPLIITFVFKGKLDPKAFNIPIPGKIGRIEGRWPWLIDL